MKNADTPAMPIILDYDTNEHNRTVVNDCYNGLTKREMFAMNAPCIEPFFEMNFAENNEGDGGLVVIFKSKSVYQLTLKGKMQAIKEWRYAYADLMLEELS